MIFVYLRNGQRIDLADAVSVVQRDQVFFLDARDEVVRQLSPEDMFAYSRISYESLEWEAPFEHPQGRLPPVPPPAPIGRRGRRRN